MLHLIQMKEKNAVISFEKNFFKLMINSIILSYKDKNLFDFSEYPVYSKFFDPANKNVIGKMKDEFKGEIISEFVGLKSKMYSLISKKDQEFTKQKEKIKN